MNASDNMNLYPKMVNDLLALSHVPRWAIVRTARQQTVADHSFRVAVIAMELSRRLSNGEFRIGETVDLCEVLVWALVHDAGESHTGDIPGHMKSIIKPNIDALEEMRCQWLSTIKVSERAMALVKVADLMESVSFIWLNRQGSHAESVWRYTDNRLREVIAQKAGILGCSELMLYGQVREMLNHIESETGRL